MTRSLLSLLLLPLLMLYLPACDRQQDRDGDADAVAATDGGDMAPPAPVTRADYDRVAAEFPTLALQVALDRAGLSPGVIDGAEGYSLAAAVAALEEANGLPVDGVPDAQVRALLDSGALSRPLIRIRLPQAMADTAWLAIPDDPQAQAELPAMGYGSPWEYLAERYHTTPATLVALNRPAPTATGAPVPAATAGTESTQPGTALPPLAAGDELLVPAIAPDLPVMVTAQGDGAARWSATLSNLGIGQAQPQAARIEVTKAEGMLRAYDEAGRLLLAARATMGSERDPLPIGDWTAKGVARNPPFHYNPELFWDVSDSAEKLTLPPGPNSPVGVVWIDLSKEHYGIHGTPGPETIGRAESHGCVRLTNWDAARLAQMVKPGVEVHFRP